MDPGSQDLNVLLSLVVKFLNLMCDVCLLQGEDGAPGAPGLSVKVSN